MKKFKIVLILLFMLPMHMVSHSQDEARYSLSAGMGYFANIENIGATNDGVNNPRYAGIYSTIGNFFEFSYRFNTGYWLGFKYLGGDFLYPFSDKLFWEDDFFLGLDVYSIVIKRSFSSENHLFDISCGPLLHNYKNSWVLYDDYEYFNIEGESVPAILNPTIGSAHWYDLGMFFAIEYKYNVVRNLNIGLKTEAYGLLYIGKQGFSLMPVLEVRF